MLVYLTPSNNLGNLLGIKISFCVRAFSFYHSYFLSNSSQKFSTTFLLQFEKDSTFNFQPCIPRHSMQCMPGYLPCRYNNHSSFYSLTQWSTTTTCSSSCYLIFNDAREPDYGETCPGYAIYSCNTIKKWIISMYYQ